MGKKMCVYGLKKLVFGEENVLQQKEKIRTKSVTQRNQGEENVLGNNIYEIKRE